LNVILPRLIAALSRIEPHYEILIIDTVTPMDGTLGICEKFGDRVRYIQREGGNSFGDAVRTGIAQLHAQFAIFMDADGSHDPEFVSELYRYKDDFDVVIASRYVAGGGTKNSPSLILMSKIVNRIYSLVLNINCNDISNSFKLYKSSELKKLALFSNNFDIVEEMLFKLKKNNKHFRIKEVPFTFNERMFGRTKRNLFVFMLTYLFTLLKLRFGK